MMQAAIIQKLSRHLQKPIDDESWVVYLLAEIRKVREQEGWLPSAPVLHLCCNWALHVHLTHPRTVDVLLEPIERYVCNTVHGLQPFGRWDVFKEINLHRELLLLPSFRVQLQAFLARHQLSTELFTDEGQWRGFLELFGKVICDGSLAVQAQSRSGAVTRVVFTKGDNSRATASPFRVEWLIHLADGRTVGLDLDRIEASGLEGVFGGVQVIGTAPSEG